MPSIKTVWGQAQPHQTLPKTAVKRPIKSIKVTRIIKSSGNMVGITVFEIILTLSKKLGSMGLPLALILVGSSLNFKEIKTDKILLTVTLLGKLIIAPLTVFVLVKLFYT